MYAMDYAQVGANIQEQLSLKGIKQQELADALSISKQVMNKIIKGYKAINVNELAQIASVLGTTTDAPSGRKRFCRRVLASWEIYMTARPEKRLILFVPR